MGRALAEAKRARIRAGAPPAAWASYVLVGDSLAAPRAPPAPDRWPFMTGLGAGLFLLLLLAGSRWRSLRTR